MNRKDRYYVYLHRRPSDGVVFYVGKGTGPRCYAKERSKRWSEFIGDEPFEVIFEKINLTETEAIILENHLIKEPRVGWQLVNVRSSVEPKVFDMDLISEFLEYDETSPSCLRWKKSPSAKQLKPSGKSYVAAGAPAGYLHGDSGRYCVKLRGSLYKAHRLIVALHGIEIPANYVVNHKDCNPSNNKIENLEVVPQSYNSQVKSDYVHGSGLDIPSGINITDYKGIKRVVARYVDMNGKRLAKTMLVEDESTMPKVLEELSKWRTDKIEEKLQLLLIQEKDRENE